MLSRITVKHVPDIYIGRHLRTHFKTQSSQNSCKVLSGDCCVVVLRIDYRKSPSSVTETETVNIAFKRGAVPYRNEQLSVSFSIALIYVC